MLEQELEEARGELARELTLEEAELEYERIFGMAIWAAGLE